MCKYQKIIQHIRVDNNDFDFNYSISNFLIMRYRNVHIKCAYFPAYFVCIFVKSLLVLQRNQKGN